MKKKINVLVVEDNEYYNKLLTGALSRSIRSLPGKSRFEMSFHSFTNSLECMKKIKSRKLSSYDTIAFVDYYVGHGINGGHILKLLKEQNNDTMVILLSQTKNIEQKLEQNNSSYFVVKDSYAPALCCLYLEQYLESKI